MSREREDRLTEADGDDDSGGEVAVMMVDARSQADI